MEESNEKEQAVESVDAQEDPSVAVHGGDDPPLLTTASNSSSNDENENENDTDTKTTLTIPDSIPFHLSHFQNPKHSVYWRRGIPIYLLATLGLLLASDIGSGVSAVTLLIPAGEDTVNEQQENTLLTASIFTAVKELWHVGSYALAVFIVITSVGWPYVKLLLSLYAWMLPYSSPARRERLITILDCLDKWSFVDVVVFSEIVVAFRATIPLGGPVLEVWVIPEWGLFGFIAANMLSQIGTHMIIYHHRKLMYSNTITVKEVSQEEGEDEDESPPPEDPSPRGLQQVTGMSMFSAVMLTILLITGTALYLAGCLLDIFRITNTRGPYELEPDDYSIVSVGLDLPTSARAQDEGAMRWLQIIWFLFGVAAPLATNVLLFLLLWVPLERNQLQRLFFCAEVSFAWSGAEVFVVSTIFAVLEIPTFGAGLIDSGCSTCYVVDSMLLAGLAVTGVGTIASMGATIWLYQVSHSKLYISANV